MEKDNTLEGFWTWFLTLPLKYLYWPIIAVRYGVKEGLSKTEIFVEMFMFPLAFDAGILLLISLITFANKNEVEVFFFVAEGVRYLEFILGLFLATRYRADSVNRKPTVRESPGSFPWSAKLITEIEHELALERAFMEGFRGRNQSDLDKGRGR